jgi:hypothetical protein
MAKLQRFVRMNLLTSINNSASHPVCYRPTMMEAVMRRSLLAVVVLGMALLAGSREPRAADAVPKFDIARGCKAEVTPAVSGIGETIASCTADEQHARDALVPIWSNYSQADKAVCVRSTAADGTPSYVELQTCLEMLPQSKPK